MDANLKSKAREEKAFSFLSHSILLDEKVFL
jgi:hypothetical protein